VIIDTSAIAAIAFDESDATELAAVIGAADRVLMSAGTLLEVSIVVTRRGQFRLDEFLEEAGIEQVPFDSEQARVAREGYASYGKGSKSPARLNLGDCFSYALAKTTGLPLLFKGDDFTHTDVVPALSR
jgi:ribonuclease VapC